MPVHNVAVAGLGAPGGHPDALMHVGLVLPVEIHVPPVIAQALGQLGKPIPTPATGYALVDTGATLTAVHAPLLTGLGLNPVGAINCGTAAGTVLQSQYPAMLVFPAHGLTIDLAAVTGVDLSGQMPPTVPPKPLVALIGRDILKNMVLIWNGPAGSCTLAM